MTDQPQPGWWQASDGNWYPPHQQPPPAPPSTRPPSTGKPFYKKWWVDVLIVLAVLIIIGAITGGSKDDKKKTASTTPASSTSSSSTSSSSSDTTTTAAPTPTTDPNAPRPIGSTAHTGDFDVTLNGVEEPFTPSNQFESAPAGDHFLSIDITMKNTDKDAHTISTLINFELTDTEGRKYQQGFVQTGQDPIDGQVPPNDQRRGFVVYQIPDGVTGLVLRVKGDVTSFGSAFQIN